MGTRGQYGIIADGKMYAVHQEYDMYPSGHPKDLFRELAELSTDERLALRDAITQIGWVDDVIDAPENKTPGSRARFVAGETESARVLSGVPDLARLREVYASTPAVPMVGSELAGAYFSKASPSFTGLAQMPVAQKARHSDDGMWRLAPYCQGLMTINFDNNTVMFSSFEPTSSSPPGTGAQLGSVEADLLSSRSLEGAAEYCNSNRGDSFGETTLSDPLTLRVRFLSDGSHQYVDFPRQSTQMPDGATKRPPGCAPFPVSHDSYNGAHTRGKSARNGSSRSRVCGKRTKSGGACRRRVSASGTGCPHHG